MDIYHISQHTRLKYCALLCIILDLLKKLSLGIQSVLIHIIWFSIKHLNIYINMGLILNSYITYNIKYPQYIYTVSKKSVLAFKVSFYVYFLHKHVNTNINVRLTQHIHNKYNDKYPQHELTLYDIWRLIYQHIQILLQIRVSDNDARILNM